MTLKHFSGRTPEDFIAAILVAFVALLICSIGNCSEINIPALADTIIQAESSGNPNAVGDRGKARGLGQIQRSVWEKFAGQNEPYSRAFEPKLNRDITELHLFDIIWRHKLKDPAKAAWLYNCGEPCKLSFHEWKKRQPNKVYQSLYV